MSLNTFLQSYLFSFMFLLGLTLGSLVVLLVSFQLAAHWGVATRRIALAGAKTIWLMALFFIPIAIFAPVIYPWLGSDASNPIVQHKAVYLNLPFFYIRAVVYFIIWIFLAWRANAAYNHQGHTVQDELQTNHQHLAAPGIIIYFLAISFAGIDWVMSLQPTWYSTAFGFVLITAQGVAGMSFAIVAMTIFSNRNQPFKRLVSMDFGPANYYRDLGVLLLVAIMLWAYVFYFQFLVIWAGNIPHEIDWYLNRAAGGWNLLFVVLFILNFVIPFIFLITQLKRRTLVMNILAWMILVGNFLFYFWMVIPAFRPRQINIQLTDIIVPIVMGIIWLLVYMFHFRRTPELVIREADLVEHEHEGEATGHQPA